MLIFFILIGFLLQQQSKIVANKDPETVSPKAYISCGGGGYPEIQRDFLPGTMI